jgi:RHS repeat-associated protein
MTAEIYANVVSNDANHGATNRRNLRPLFLFVCVIAWLLGPNAATVRGQSADPLTAIGIPPFSAQIPVENGYINAGSGGVHLEFPLGTFPQRGGRQFKAVLTYDSAIWQEGTGLSPDNSTFHQFFTSSNTYDAGWNYVTSADGGGPIRFTSQHWSYAICTHQTPNAIEYTYYKGWTWRDPRGGTHLFPITTEQGFFTQCYDYSHDPTYNHPTGDAFAADASGYHMYVSSYTSAKVYAPDGTLVATTDTNGNQFGYDSAGNPIDTLGRIPVIKTQSGNTVYFDVLNSSGGRGRYTVTLVSIYACTNFVSSNCMGGADYPSNHTYCPSLCPLTAVQSIQLPDGTSYSFTYDSGTTQGHYSEMISMHLPSGGQINYSYASFADSTYFTYNLPHITRMIKTMTTPDGNWTFTPAVVFQCTQPNQTGCQQSLSVAKPSGDRIVYTSNIDGGVFPIKAEYYSTSGTLLATQTNAFDYGHVAQGCNLANAGFPCPTGGHAYITQLSSTVILPVPGGPSLNQTTQYCYDRFAGTLTKKWEWNFYTGAIVADPTHDTCALNATTAPDRTTTTTYQAFNSFPSQNIVDRPASVTITDKIGTMVSQTINSYDDWTLATTGATGLAHHDDLNYSTSNTVRGNLTQSKRWLNTTGSFIVTSNHYDIAGNLIQKTDPKGNSTYFDYTDNFYGVSPSPPTAAYVTKITKPVTTGVNHIERTQYYYGSGLPSAKCGENFVPASCAYGLSAPQSDYVSNSYENFFDRPLTTKAGDGGQTSWNYGISPSSATSTTTIDGSHNLVNATVLDGLGRKFQTQTSSGQGTIYTDFTYDSNGRVRTVSNPHFSTSSSTDGTTTYSSYDGLDRVLVVTEQDGSTVNTLYAGNCKTATDEASKARKLCYDGFGRMTGVWEDPGSSPHLNYETDYQYDLLDNLLSVTQNGSRQRTFAYDSVSRLLCAANPEIQIVTCPNPDTGTYTNGTIRYAYDANGNLTTRTAPKPNQTSASVTVVTTYAYDPLNRLTSKSYSDGVTPTYGYYYDTLSTWGYPSTNTIGRLAAETNNINTFNFRNYDVMGRVYQLWNCLPPNCNAGPFYSETHYDLAGDTISETNLPFVTLTRAYDTAGRPTQLTSNWVDSQHPASLVSTDSSVGYWPIGTIRKMTFGNGLTQATAFDNRSQPCRINYNSSASYLTLCTDAIPSGNTQDLKTTYNFGSTDNRNVASWVGSGNQTFNRSYVYDALNRLSTLTDSATGAYCPGATWTYDAWGNRWAQGGSCPRTFSGTINTKNQIASAGSTNFVYDAAGNLTNDGTFTYNYDAENHLTAVGGASAATYAYDADGQRAQRIVSGISMVYLRDVSGNVIGELDGGCGPTCWTKGYVYFNGQRIAEYTNGTTYFTHLDHLGSTRLMTGVTGSIADSMDFLPFGEQISGGTGTNHKFTGKERDSESGLDNLGARYDSSQYGRFMTPDEPFADQDPSDPQSWNLYSYVRNNPLSFTDPNGDTRFCVTTDGPNGPKTTCQEEPDPDTNGSPAGGGLNWDQINQGVRNFVDVATQATHDVVNWMSQPRDPGCMAASMGAGSATGAMAGGVVGFAGAGVGEFALSPAGAGIGAGVGYAAGMISCMTGSGGSGGGGSNTKHGDERIAGRKMSPEEIAQAKTGKMMTQADGAKVFVKDVGNGKFNVVVEGDRGIITVLKSVDSKALANLAQNYGWK